MAPDYVIGVDQGTSGTKALPLDRDGRVVAEAGRPTAVTHPAPGSASRTVRSSGLALGAAEVGPTAPAPGP